MLSVVDKECELAPDRSKCTIVLESDCAGPPFQEAHDELDGVNARSFAIAAAIKMGMPGAHLNATPGIHPVNKKGQSLDEVKGKDGDPLPPTHADMQPHRYRLTVRLVSPSR